MNDSKDQPRTKAELLREITKLRQALERFEIAVQGSNEGLWDWDIVNNQVFFSARWKSMLGYEDHEITNDFAEFESRLHPDDHGRVMAVVADYLAGQIEVYEVEFRCQHKDGSYRWILARGHSLRNESGLPYRMAGSHTDITAQKQAEEALRISEVRNRNLLQAIPDMIIRYRADGTYLDIKPSKDFRAFRPPHELIGKNLFEVAPPEVAQKRMDHIQLALQTGQVQTYEHSFVRESGTRFEEIWVVPTTVADEVFVVIRDVTERRQAQEALVKRAAELQTVANVGTAASTILEVDKLLQEVVDLTKSSFNLYHAHVYLFNQARDILVLTAGAGQVGQQMIKKGWSIPLEREQSLVARAARSRQGVVVNDVRQEPDFLPNPLLPHTRAEMAIPLIVGNQVLGVLDVQSEAAGRFTEEDVRIKTILAGQIAVALQNARSFAEEQQAQRMLSKRINELNCLNDLGREIAETPPVPELLRWISGRIIQAMQYPALCKVAIEYEDQVYGQPSAIELPCQIVNALRIGGEVIGRVYIAYTEKREFLDEESALIGGIASRLSGYIESRLLLEQTREAQAESVLLYMTANRLIQAADSTELLEAASAYARSLGASSGQLLYLDSDAQSRPEWAEIVAQWQSISTSMPLGSRFHMPDFALYKLWISQPDQPLLIAETMTSELVDPPMRKLLVQTQAHALALLPLNIKGRWIGLVSFSWNTPYPFTERDQRILTTIAQQTATVVDSVRTSQQIQVALAENQQQKEFLGKVIDILPVGLFAKDVQDNYRFSIWNAKMEQLFGAKAEDMLGKNDYDFFSDKDEADYYRQTDISVMEAGQLVDIPVEEVTTRLGVILAHTTKLPIYNSEGNPEVLLGILEDITERKRAEETLRQSEARLSEALSIARLANWEFDVATQTFTFNDQFYSLFRTTAEQEGGYLMPAMTYAQKFVHPEDAPIVGIEIQKALETSDPNYSTQVEHRIIRADGSEGYILVKFRVVKDQQGRTVKTIGANQDITERKLAELERERLLTEVETTYRQYVRGEWEQLLQEQQDSWRIEHQVQPVEQTTEVLNQLQDKVLNEGKTAVITPGKNNGHETEPVMVVPISLRGQVIGTLSLQDIAPDRIWTEEELTLVETVSEQLALTLENLRLYEETQRAAWRDRVVSESTAKVWSSAEIEEVMRTAVAQLGDKLRASEVVIRLGTEVEINPRIKAHNNKEIFMFNKVPQMIGLIILLGSLMVACNPFVATKEPDQITIQFSWFHNAEFAGFYVADQKGYYTDENLKVTFVGGGPEVDPVAEVLTGRALFGITAGDRIIRARATAQDVVAVAAIFRHSPLVVMALANSGIQRPQELVGKTVGVISPKMDTTWDIQFLGMLNKLKIKPTDLTFIPIKDYHGANELTSGRMQAASSFFSSNEPVQAQLDGHETTQMFYSDYGIEIYSNTIFTTDQIVHKQPDLVKRFIRATLKGYQYAIEHPEEVANFTLKYDNTLDSDLQRATMQAQIPLIDTGDAPIGVMDESVWQITEDILLEQGFIAAPIDIKTAYTNEFVEKKE